MLDTRLCVDEILELLRTDLPSYLPVDVPAPAYVRFGTVPPSGFEQSPAMFVYPVSIQPSRTEQSLWESEVVLKITTGVTEESIETADRYALEYIDAVQNLFITHHETDHVWDLVPGIGAIDYETVAGSRLATVTVTCTLRAGE